MKCSPAGHLCTKTGREKTALMIFNYYVAEAWLQKFAYHIELTPLLFVQAALFILIISLITVGIQSYNTARKNPVDALKEQ